ncbi:MAG TPA: hypothetical protein VFW44_08455 [Bryobacteraceae bacterium]|nr:hypothetical protein [Bryobacteraceae bacterium]
MSFMLKARWTDGVKPLFAIVANIDIRFSYLESAFSRIKPKISFRVASRGRYSHIARGMFCLGLLGNASVYATQIVIKVVGDVIYVAADSQGVEQGNRFGTCKILRVKEGSGAIFFSYAGHSNPTIYDVRSNAREIAKRSGSLDEADSVFGSSYPGLGLLTGLARASGIAPTDNFEATAFYGMENQKPKVLFRQFEWPGGTAFVRTKTFQTCPPNCGNFIGVGDRGVLKTWADSHKTIYDKGPAEMVECLVRQAMTLPEAQGVVGGAVSVAKIDASGFTFLDNKAGACEDGPYEQRHKLAPNPPACDISVHPSKKKSASRKNRSTTQK